MTDKKVAKSSQKIKCDVCHYSTCKKTNYTKHILTDKHKILTSTDTNTDICYKKEPTHICECGKTYLHRQSLHTHKKLCEHTVKINDTLSKQISKQISQQITPDMILNILAQNKDLTSLIIEQNKTITDLSKNTQLTMVQNNSNNNSNSHNKTFNLHFFLNETCKNAMNISEFIENIKVDISDLENMGRVGYVEGMSCILIKNLNMIDVTKRPIHCTDKKREIMYIKDNNIWEKDDDQKNKLHKTIKRVSHKNIKILPAYREKYPGCEFAISRFSDNYNKMIVEVMGGPGDNDTEKEDKIIQKVSKYITINKGVCD